MVATKKDKKERKAAKKKQKKLVKALSLKTKKSHRKDGDEIRSQADINEEIRLQALYYKLMVRKFLDHYSVIVFFTLVTVYALFADDIRILTCN